MQNWFKYIAGLTITLSAASVVGHPATERYIPMGQSPGVSNNQSYVGPIRSVNTENNGFTMTTDSREKYIKMTERTPVFLFSTSGAPGNKLGSYADCENGRNVEVYLDADDNVVWLKVQTR